MDAAVGPAAMVENHDALDALLASEEPADPREELLEALACHPYSMRAIPSRTRTRLDSFGDCGRASSPLRVYTAGRQCWESTKRRSQAFDRPNTRFD